MPLDEPALDSGSNTPDYFVIDPRVSARVKGYVDTTAFRFVFTSQTAALRNFLNRLASFELPVLVREVEVDAATAEESVMVKNGEEVAVKSETESETPASVVLAGEPVASKGNAAKAVAGKASATARPPRTAMATPIVSKSLSKYTVTVEFIELVPAPAAAAETPPPTP